MFRIFGRVPPAEAGVAVHAEVEAVSDTYVTVVVVSLLLLLKFLPRVWLLPLENHWAIVKSVVVVVGAFLSGSIENGPLYCLVTSS